MISARENRAAADNDQPELVSARIFPTFGDLSRDRQIIRCYLHHNRNLVTVIRPQIRLEPLADFGRWSPDVASTSLASSRATISSRSPTT
jgi:hypothetical protein